MGQILHDCARTTAAVRRAIQHSQESLLKLAERYDINPKTVLLGMASTGAACQWFRGLGFHVLVESSLGTVLYGILLTLPREIRPNKRHLGFVLERVNFKDKSKP